MSIQRLPQRLGHGKEVLCFEPSSDIQKVERVSLLPPHFEHHLRSSHSVIEHLRILASASDVERHSYDVEVEGLSGREEGRTGFDGRSELESETTEGFGIVGEDSKDEFRSRVEFGDLEKFVGVVEGHGVDAEGTSGSDEGGWFTRVGEDDLVGGGREREGEDRGHLGLGGTIEAGSEEGEELEDERIGVALDGCKGAK